MSLKNCIFILKLLHADDLDEHRNMRRMLQVQFLTELGLIAGFAANL